MKSKGRKKTVSVEFNPRILCFCCSWCSYAGADLAGANLVEAKLVGAYLYNIKNKRICAFQVGKHFGYYADSSINVVACLGSPILLNIRGLDNQVFA